MTHALSSFSQSRDVSDDKTPLERTRTFVYDCHENLMCTVGSLFSGMGDRLYGLPSDQLCAMLHQGCCAAFDHIPDLKLNNLLRILCACSCCACGCLCVTTERYMKAHSSVYVDVSLCQDCYSFMTIACSLNYRSLLLLSQPITSRYRIERAFLCSGWKRLPTHD